MDTLVQELLRIDTPTLANAIERLAVRNPISGFCNRTLRCLTPQLGVLCGYAVTAEVETMNADVPGGLDATFVDLCQAVLDTAEPAVVVLRESSGLPEFSAHCGECMAKSFQRAGAHGIVSNGAVRDFDEMSELGFRCFATGFVPSHGNFRVVRIQVPVTVCGLQIQPGDLLHGDVNGLLKVPRAGRNDILQEVGAVRAAEQQLLNYLNQEEFQIAELRKLLVH